ncbi:MAG TPA: hypothetical protein VGY13_13085 [Solirubrobacteraceae bacterium]|jgi:hypothetical protein|nr:hypothetical protein [Solirubrobacteraceae bacterium]
MRVLTAAALPRVALALALAGCGGSSGPTVAGLSTGKAAASSASSAGDGSPPETTTGHQQKEVDYAKCLRAHGAGEVPEPGNGRSIVNGLGGDGPDPGPPRFKAAQKRCDGLLPSGGGPSAQARALGEERALRFARCMRAHGQPGFPDPLGAGHGAVRIGGAGSGIDLDSPRFEAAQKACRRYFGPAGSQGAP